MLLLSRPLPPFSGATIVFVNHGIEAIKQFCDQAIVLQKGKLVLNTTDINQAIELYTGETYIPKETN